MLELVTPDYQVRLTGSAATTDGQKTDRAYDFCEHFHRPSAVVHAAVGA